MTAWRTESKRDTIVPMLNRYVLLPLAAAAVLCAQTADPLSSEMKASYNGIKNNLIKMAEKMPEENYSYKPSPDIRTFGGLMGHVADANYRTCTSIAGEAKNLGASQKTSKADLVAAMKAAFEACDPIVNGLTDATAKEMVTTPRGARSKLGMLNAMIIHDNEEYGYTAVYMRMKGVVPPSSEGR